MRALPDQSRHLGNHLQRHTRSGAPPLLHLHPAPPSTVLVTQSPTLPGTLPPRAPSKPTPALTLHISTKVVSPQSQLCIDRIQHKRLDCLTTARVLLVSFPFLVPVIGRVCARWSPSVSPAQSSLARLPSATTSCGVAGYCGRCDCVGWPRVRVWVGVRLYLACLARSSRNDEAWPGWRHGTGERHGCQLAETSGGEPRSPAIPRLLPPT